MEPLMIFGIILLVIGILAVFLKVKFLPFDKNAHIWALVIGVLIVTGLGVTLWSGLAGLFSAGAGATTGAVPTAYLYSITATAGSSAYTVDETNKVITVPLQYNTTPVVNHDPVKNNFTISVADSSSDMRGVKISCSTPTYYSQNESKTDSNLYAVVTKDSEGKSDIRVYDTAMAYVKRERTFLLGGESSSGQSISVEIYADIDPTGVGELDTYNSKDISCNIGGIDWKIRIQKASIGV